MLFYPALQHGIQEAFFHQIYIHSQKNRACGANADLSVLLLHRCNSLRPRSVDNPIEDVIITRSAMYIVEFFRAPPMEDIPK